MIVFFATFLLYLFTLFPGVAPYRDTGEMVSVAHTLGVAHPPGYPLYTLLSRVFLSVVPWGSEGYRLNVLSALAGAGTAWLVYALLRLLALPRRSAALLALLFATSYLQWYLSLVSEMYTLNTLFAAALLLILLAADRRSRADLFPAAAFLFGLGLGNRMDLLLFGTGMAWFVFKYRRTFTPRHYLLLALLFLAGFSVFLYLPLRSGAGPWLDWNHPADLSRFWGSLTRKTHGGTLDLVSAPYAPGANFPATIMFYGKHLVGGFTLPGTLLGAFGLIALWRRDRTAALATSTAWAVSGPLFVYLANMPPNPHALAILEAHFLLPNLVVILWIGEGLRAAAERFSVKHAAAAAAAVAGALVIYNASTQVPHLYKRKNFVAYDFSKNVLRSLPPGGAVVLKEDVQLFSLWNRQLVEGERPDAAVVSQGLAGSFWYQEPMRRRYPGLRLVRLGSPDAWRHFATENPGREVSFSNDADFDPIEGYAAVPNGLVNTLAATPSRPRGDILLNAIYAYRGPFTYEAYREFFTPDLIEDYAKAHANLGRHYLSARDGSRARASFRQALALQPHFPAAASFLAFSWFDEGNFTAAISAYREAAAQYGRMLALARDYHALPDVTNALSRELSGVLLSAGVCAERLGDDAEALRRYAEAVSAHPQNARAYFNRAVVFWKRGEWRNVTSELEKALAAEPGYPDAAFYLGEARKRLAAAEGARP